MKPERWKELHRENVFSKYGRKVDKVLYRLPDGTESDYYIKDEGDYVCVLALTKDNKIVLARQYRPGPDRILLELPGGRIDEGEDPALSASRELLEETGFQGKIESAGNFLTCAYSITKCLVFVATGCEKVGEPMNSASEICEAVLLDIPEFRKLLQSGQLTDVEGGYMGLDYLGLLK